MNAERFLTYDQSTADFQFHCYQIYALQRFIPDVSPRYEHKESLRKTSSMPSVEQTQQAHVEAIRQLLDSFPIAPCKQSSSAHEHILENSELILSTAWEDAAGKSHFHNSAIVLTLIVKVWGTPRQSLVPEPVDTESDDEIINTDIEELRDAAQ
ncbi:unnamed protein product, partial [Gongylonema pulchrum]|uniref:Uncharacterized protein n=1 Tax=Gongylonema pulchrum TaxID=637853 RepID=A0A183EJC3_9BILA